MAFLLPSFFQKRILRYALSRLEFLDAKDHDLDDLNVVWGKRSTVELRNVGIHIRRLSALLRLPHQFTLVTARVLLLRITVPADLYRSGILVEVDGLKIEYNLGHDDEETSEDNKSHNRKDAKSRLRKDFKRAGSRSTQFQVHDPGGNEADGEGDYPFEHIPTTTDLAKSFVQAESKEERVELQNAIAHSQYLTHSATPGGLDEDGSGFGMGGGLSLPGFVAEFLKGVGDRVELSIKNADVKMVMDLDFASGGPYQSFSPKSDLVTIHLSIQEVLLEGLTTSVSSDNPRNGLNDAETNNSTEGLATVGQSRRMQLKNIFGMVMADTTLFSNLSRCSVPPSPILKHSNRGKNSYKASPASASPSDPPSSVSKFETTRSAFTANEDDDRAKVSLSPLASLTEVLSYGSEVKAARVELSPQDPKSSNSQYGDDMMAYSLDSNEGDRSSVSQPNQSKSSVPGSSLDFGAPNSSPERLRRGDKRSHRQGSEPEEGTYQKNVLSSPNLDHTPKSSRGSPQPESLAQSKLFSHEEAESMYMSAMSQLRSHSGLSQPVMPGNWGDSDFEQVQAEETSDTRDRVNANVESQDSEISPSVLGENAHPPTPQQMLESRRSVEIPEEQAARTRRVSLPSDSGYANPENTRDSSVKQGSSLTSEASSENELLVKKIVSIDSLALEIPSSGDDESVDSVSPTSTAQSYQSAGTERDLRSTGARTATPRHKEPALEPANLRARPGTNIKVGHIGILGDMNLTKLTILVAQRLTRIFTSCSPEHKSGGDKEPRFSQVAFQIERVTWKFLDLVRGISISQPGIFSSSLRTADDLEDTEVLLKALMTKLKLITRSDGLSSESTFSVSKVDFGYASDNIFSFDSGLKMRNSNRDILAPIDQDIVVKISKSPNRKHLEVTTLPLHIRLDLRRLDEIFSWFGGFSSILGLGNSMISTVTVSGNKQKISRPVQSSRGVHFKHGEQECQPTESSDRTQEKVNVRVGGLVFDLEGTSVAFHLESTAIKVVSRVEGVGLAVDRLNLTGPFVEPNAERTSISAKIVGLRLEYLPNPKDVDLARLLGLLSPSKDRYNEEDDDILVETLFRQRRQGGVVRITVENVDGNVHNAGDLYYLPALMEEMKKLSTVAKYLPEDDRPGIMTLLLIRQLQLQTTVNNTIGQLSLAAKHAEVAHITLPSLSALAVRKLDIERNTSEDLLGEAIASTSDLDPPPMIMARFIGNEMEPTIKIKLHSVRTEYRASTIAVLLGIPEALAKLGATDIASSVATVTTKPRTTDSPPILSAPSSSDSEKSSTSSKTLKIDIALHDVIIGLNPREPEARGVFLLTDSHILYILPKDDEVSATFKINQGTLMVIDHPEKDYKTMPGAERGSLSGNTTQAQQLLGEGYISVCSLSAAKVAISISKSQSVLGQTVEAELRDMLLVIESCADSTQTLQTILAGLQPPQVPIRELKYRTEVIPIEEMLTSFSGDAFATQETVNDDFPLGLEEGDMVDDDVLQNLEFVSSFYNPTPETLDESVADSMLEEDLDSLASPPVTRTIGDKPLLESFQEQYQVAPGEFSLNINENHFDSSSNIGGTAHRWKVEKNIYELTNEPVLRASPFKLRVRNIHVIWNLFDGYDWQQTRDTISQAVAAVEEKAMEQRSRKARRRSFDTEEEDSVIGDFLFNSIYIGIPTNRDPRELGHQVSRNIDDLASETGSYATSRDSDSPSRQDRATHLKSKVRLKRSKYHKMTFELKGISADVVVFPPESGETQSSIDIRVQDLEIFDHVPTSTWKKFATYMHDAGERENGTSMIHLEIQNVKPVPDLAASEIILKVTVLPLRLHVDQDALDFMTRFFEFRTSSTVPPSPKEEASFLQRVEVKPVPVKLSFKPKRVDYAGLRSGHTTEFMNFFVLDDADMVLRHVIIYGVSGFDKLGKTLNDIWMPDVKRNQLPGVLAGLAPIRSLINVGGGVKDLVVVPIREYRKDGRVVRSFQKGALAFAKTTTSELTKLGAKLAIGTQTVLQGAEGFLSPENQRRDVSAGWEDAELEEEERNQISLYAEQPVGVIQGLRGGYASLERDLLMAKDAIVAMPGEVIESGSAGRAARAVLRSAPTVILRPAMGVSKAVSQTLMGATNSLDPANRRRVDDKYKRH